ncbi:hypothetical protein C8F04DRAFT_1277433 [Mycena alexandri]|uniref:Uncharacterized protein n=1 Tax=Mycena alexandri TaxID=1745969 RepID=A0AAD6S196_9AGAR|nr:hypothetical protein C8F04DRAFT_1277433 [Mycena alexandri]
MYRHTRTGKQFSPFEGFLPVDISKLDRSQFQIHQLDISLEELFATADEAAEKYAQDLEEAVIDPDDSGSEWEELESRPPTPDLEPEGPILPTENPHPHFAEPTAASSSDTPALSSEERHRLRKSEYDKRRCQEKRKLAASSPFTRKVHPKSLPTHRMLPSHQSTFDAADFQTSGGGAWLGARQSDSTTKNGKRKKGAKKATKAAPMPRRLPTADELVKEKGHEYICWDGKHPLLILDRYGRIIVAFAGAPEDPEWPSVIRNASNAMKEVREEGFR